MDDRLIKNLLHQSEGQTLDFKREQYVLMTDEEKSELIKDVLAFSNSWRTEDAHILIGVEENKGQRAVIHGVQKHLEDANIQQLINSKLNRSLTFAVINTQVDGKPIDIITIPPQKRPFYLRKPFGKLKHEVVYLRQGSSTRSATIDEIAEMGAGDTKALRRHNLSLFFAESSFDFGRATNVKTLVGTELELHMQRLSQKEFDTLNGGFIPIDHLFDPSAVLGTKMKLVSFGITNVGEVPVTGVHVQITIPIGTGLFVLPAEGVFTRNLAGIIENIKSREEKGVRIHNSRTHFEISYRLPRLLPTKTKFLAEDIYLGGITSQEVRLGCNMALENPPDVLLQELRIKIAIDELSGAARSETA